MRCTFVAMIAGMAAAPAPGQCTQQQTLTADDAGGGDDFGSPVFVSGTTAIIAAQGDDCAAGTSCGSAYVFRFDGTAWVQEQKLTAADPQALDQFGNAVSLSGETAVVSAPFRDCAAGIECGSVYVFRFNGASWVQEQKLTASDADASDRFGYSVAVSGGTAVVGSFRDDCAAGSDCGAAYVFSFNGTSWVEQQKLTAADASPSALFGGSVSLTGDTAIVGAPQGNCAVGNACGAAYVFRFDGTSWVQEQKLTASDAGVADGFGMSVSLSADTAVVGAHFHDCAAGNNCGAAYVFRFNGTAWVQEQKLTAADAAPADLFGLSVTLSADTAVVGSFRDDCPAGIECGSAYVFRFNGTSWLQDQKLTAADAGMGDQFGGSVSASGDTALVGASFHDCAAGNNCGAAYVFTCGPPNPIPTATTWGLASLTLLLLAAGAAVFRKTTNAPDRSDAR